LSDDEITNVYELTWTTEPTYQEQGFEYTFKNVAILNKAWWEIATEEHAEVIIIVEVMPITVGDYTGEPGSANVTISKSQCCAFPNYG